MRECELPDSERAATVREPAAVLAKGKTAYGQGG